MLDQGQGMLPYQGFTPIAGGSLSACAESYSRSPNRFPPALPCPTAKAANPGAANTGARAA